MGRESSMESTAKQNVSFCHCGLPTAMKTSWTTHNPSRRFLGCQLYGNSENRRPCRYFEWVDPPMTPRDKAVVLGLLKKIKEMEKKEMEMKKRNERILWCLGFALTILTVLLLKWNLEVEFVVDMIFNLEYLGWFVLCYVLWKCDEWMICLLLT